MGKLVIVINASKPQKASLLVDLVRSIKSKVILTDGVYIADARSFLELLLLWSTTRKNEFHILIEGEDEVYGAEKIGALFKDERRNQDQID